MPPQMLFTLIASVCIFLLVLCIWSMGLLFWAGRKQRRTRLVEHRLGLSDTSPENTRTLRLWLDGREVETAVGRDAKTDLSARFANLCHDAGWESPPHTILLGALGMICAAFAIALTISGNIVVAAGIACLLGTVLWIYAQRRVHHRREIFDNQLIDALDLAARSLRVGHPLVNSLRLVSEEVGAPIGPMFASIVQQQELGVSMDEAIRKTAQASSSDDLKLFATAVVIQLRSGGNLADMMARVANVMRDRMRLGRRVRVLITQAQFSKQILLALPVFMFVLLNWLNPDYMRPLYVTTDGMMILGTAVALLIVGAIILNRLATIRY